MPTVSQFHGVRILFYYNDHQPPHFHAQYAEDEALFRIDSLTVLQGNLPKRAQKLVEEWAAQHQAELAANWQLARAGQPLAAIDPLP